MMGSTLEEHLGYISDPIRTALFHQAIIETVRPGDVVVDLGCGFGLLGILCLQAGAGKVWGVDQTNAIDIAHEVATRAGFENRYLCVRGRSFDISLPERADVIICDHIGFFGFDYGIIELLHDARRRFLKPGGKVIPLGLELSIAGIESPRLEQAAAAWRDPAIPPEFHWLADYGANHKYGENFDRAEIATSEDTVAAIDFAAHAEQLISGSCTLRSARDAGLSGLGGWFKAALTNGVTMTNSPLDDGSIRRKQLFLPFEQSLETLADDTIEVEIKAHHESNILSWAATNTRTGEKRFQSTWRSRILPIVAAASPK